MSDDITKVATPRGEGRSITALNPENISSTPTASPGENSDWFGPRQPMRPVAPPEVAGRQFDYPVGFNLATEPRAWQPVSFHTLRNLADAYDPLRLVIEKRKEQICRIPWQIRARSEDGATRSTASAQTRGLIKDATQFFKQPSDGLNFRAWLKMLLEDLLVLDAPTLYCERDQVGNLTALSPVDGATIRPVIDDMGRRPRAIRWDGQPFFWNGGEVNTENYLDIGCRIVDGLLYVPAYSQTLKGLPAVHYTIFDLLQKPMNVRTNSVFGRSPVELVMMTVNIAFRRANSQLQYFAEGNQPQAFFGLPETWGPDKVQQFQDYFDSLYSGNLANRRKLKFIPSGTNSKYTPVHEPPLKSEIDEWLTRIVCFAFSYPPAALVSLSNRSIAEQHEKQSEEEGLEPLKAWVADLINEVIEREFSDKIEFVFSEEQEIDPEKQSTVLTRYAEAGILTVIRSAKSSARS